MIRLLEIGLLAFLLFYLQQFIYQKLWNQNLKTELFFENNAIFEGEEGRLNEVISNQKRLPLPMLKVRVQTDRHLIFGLSKGSRTTDQYYRNDVFHVSGGEKLTRSITFVGGKRGYYRIQSMELVATDLFFTMEMVETVPANINIYVYPKPFDSAFFQMTLRQLNGEILTKQHLLEDPFEYRGIREYEPSDDMRSINWKATARTGQLKVNQKNYTALPSVRIFFDVEDRGVLKSEECVEACFQIAAGLGEYFLGQGMRVSCYGNGLDFRTKKPLRVESSTGRGQMEQLYRNLARIDTNQPAVDFVETFGEEILDTKKNELTCIIAFHQYRPFVELLCQMKNIGQDFIWFYPVWDSNDPSVPDSLKESVRMLHIRK